MFHIKLRILTIVDFLFEEAVKYNLEFKLFYFHDIRCSIYPEYPIFQNVNN